MAHLRRLARQQLKDAFRAWSSTEAPVSDKPADFEATTSPPDCQTIGPTGITAGIVLIDEDSLEELSVRARKCAAPMHKGKVLLCRVGSS